MGQAIITLSGNLGADWERKVTNSGLVIFTNSLAVTKKVGGAENTSWYRLVAFGDKMEWVTSYTKGGRMQLIGDCMIKKFTDKENIQRSSIEVKVTTVLGGESSGAKQSYPSKSEDDGHSAAFDDDWPT